MNDVSYGPDFYATHADGSLRSAQQVVPLLLSWFTPASVVELGCGIGTWLSVFQRSGVEDILGVDGPWVTPAQLRIPAERFRTADLTRPLDLDRGFDLALSCEVAEHLDAAHADQFVASLTNLAPIVAFSAAIPLQGGRNHVNEQWPDYWYRKFDAQGFACFDVLRPRLWDNGDVGYHYAQNLVVYVKRPVDPALVRTMLDPLLDRAYRGAPARLVHPSSWQAVASHEVVSAKRLLAALPRLILKKARKRLRPRSR